MTTTHTQIATFKLDKAHFLECFEQSAPPVKNKDYAKAAVLGLFGVGLFFVEAKNYYIPFFIFCLGVVELLSVKYRKIWWVWRQLMSKAANGVVEVSIDDSGIATESEQVNSFIKWADVNSIKETEKGLLIKHMGGINYLSSSHLSEESIRFVLSQRP